MPWLKLRGKVARRISIGVNHPGGLRAPWIWLVGRAITRIGK